MDTLSPGQEADVALSITEITTSQSAIERFTPTERDCYTHDEVNLKSLPLKKGHNCYIEHFRQSLSRLKIQYLAGIFRGRFGGGGYCGG
jgi:hypothetical protein